MINRQGLQKRLHAVVTFVVSSLVSYFKFSIFKTWAKNSSNSPLKQAKNVNNVMKIGFLCFLLHLHTFKQILNYLDVSENVFILFILLVYTQYKHHSF